MALIIFAAFWVICSIIAYGACVAFFWKEYQILQDEPNRWEELVSRGRLYALFGPVAIIVFAFEGAFRHGLMYRNPNKKGK